MGTYSQEERDKMPTSAFCGPSRTFPILDQEDVHNAVSRLNTTDHAVDPIKACIIGKAKAHGWDYPDAWKPAEHSVGAACPSGVGADFDGTESAPTDGEYVTRRGLIFRAGDYPDKSFSADPEDLWAATLGFAPVPIDLEHVPTVLQSKLGTLDKIELSDDGSELYGEVRLPAWLDAVLSDGERKVSCTWDRATKRLTGLALVRTPRVTDAALMAAFAGQRHSANDAADMQRIHDPARGRGAECNDPEKGNEMTTPEAQPNAEQTLMSKFFSWMTSGAPAAPATVTTPAPATFGAPATGQAPAAPQATQPDPEKELLKQQLAQLRAQQIGDRAASFAAEQIAAGKALPAQRDALIAAYSVAAADDAEHGQATFGSGKTSRVDTLAGLFTNAPAHTLTTELVPVDPSKMRQLPTPGQLTGTADARFSDGKVDNAEVLRLLGTDPVGKTILRDMALTAATAGGKAGK